MRLISNAPNSAESLMKKSHLEVCRSVCDQTTREDFCIDDNGNTIHAEMLRQTNSARRLSATAA